MSGYLAAAGGVAGSGLSAAAGGGGGGGAESDSTRASCAERRRGVRRASGAAWRRPSPALVKRFLMAACELTGRRAAHTGSPLPMQGGGRGPARGARGRRRRPPSSARGSPPPPPCAPPPVPPARRERRWRPAAEGRPAHVGAARDAREQRPPASPAEIAGPRAARAGATTEIDGCARAG